MNLRVGNQGDRPLLGILFYSISIFLSTLIGAMTRLLGKQYPPNEILFFRALVVIIILFAFFWIKGKFSLVVAKAPKVQVIRAILGFVAVIASIKCYVSLSMAQATTLINTTPFFIAFFAWPLLGEKITLPKMMAIIIGFLGILATIQPDLESLEIGMIFGLLTAFLRCFISIFMRSAGKSDHPFTTVFYYSGICFVLSGVWLCFNWVTPSFEHLLFFLMMGLVTFFSEIAYAYGARYAQAIVLSPYSYFALLWGAVLGYLFCGEVPTSSIILGSSLIIGSGLYIFYLERKQVKCVTS